jgi:aspartyl-tRNA(Asn)/glutamyl-tRNA(Gln) amidotransferase subunit B
VKRAIEFEAKRLIELLESGGTVTQQTRSYDADNDITFATRDKEDADDYRYFADPDLTPFSLEERYIDAIRKAIPALPEERIKKYAGQYKLSEYDAQVLTEEKAMSDYFEKIISSFSSTAEGNGLEMKPKAAANWLLGPVKSWLNENGKEITGFPLEPRTIAALIQLIDAGKLSFSTASTKLFTHLIKDPGKDPEQAAIEQQLIQQSDTSFLEPVIDKVLEKFADKVTEYRKGKKGLLSLFVGEVMKQSKGKADPKMTNELLLKKLNA